MAVDSIAAWIFKEDIEGVVVSGGEPLLQYEDLIKLLGVIKQHKLGVILYSGWSGAVLQVSTVVWLSWLML